MTKLPPKELLESTHTFPGKYVFKAIGKSDEAFRERVLAAVREAAGEGSQVTHTVRETEGGRHVAITLELHAETAEQVLGVYRAILGVEGLLVLL